MFGTWKKKKKNDKTADNAGDPVEVDLNELIKRTILADFDREFIVMIPDKCRYVSYHMIHVKLSDDGSNEDGSKVYAFPVPPVTDYLEYVIQSDEGCFKYSGRVVPREQLELDPATQNYSNHYFVIDKFISGPAVSKFCERD